MYKANIAQNNIQGSRHGNIQSTRAVEHVEQYINNNIHKKSPRYTHDNF